MKIKIKLQKNAVTPKRSTDGAIGYDLYIPCDTQVYQGRNILPLNFAIEMSRGLEAKIEPRSGFASKGMEGKSLPDMQGHQYTARYDADVLVGKIDPDYRGNVGVIINNHDQSFILPKGTRIAQMTFYKVELPSFEVVDELSSTERGEGGFGSTGVMSKESCKVEDDIEIKETFYKSGQIASRTSIKDGELNGECKRWYENGQLWVQENYKNGVIDGEFKEWYENGQLWAQGTYKDGKLDGEYKRWWENGVLYRHEVYQNDKKVKDLLK